MGASAENAAKAERAIPATIEHYRIVKILGRGGMGEVYLARDPRAGDREVAIKTVPICEALPAEKRETLRTRLRQEAHALGKVTHSAVPTLYHVIESEVAFYVVMEFVEGTSLTQAMRQGEWFSPEDSVRIAVQLLGALSAAHAQDLVHSDVKPSNIMLTRDRHVKLIDFGLARDVEIQMYLARTDATPGTPGYMAPEQISGKRATPASDIFCLGIVLYELLARRHPFSGRTDTELAFSVLYQEPPDLRDLGLGIPDSLASIVMRALSKDPSRRPGGAAAMARSLEEALESFADRPSAAAVGALDAKASSGSEASREARAARAGDTRKSRRGLLVATLAAAAVLLLALGLGVALKYRPEARGEGGAFAESSLADPGKPKGQLPSDEDRRGDPSMVTGKMRKDGDAPAPNPASVTPCEPATPAPTPPPHPAPPATPPQMSSVKEEPPKIRRAIAVELAPEIRRGESEADGIEFSNIVKELLRERIEEKGIVVDEKAEDAAVTLRISVLNVREIPSQTYPPFGPIYRYTCRTSYTLKQHGQEKASRGARGANDLRRKEETKELARQEALEACAKEVVDSIFKSVNWEDL